MSHIIQSLRQNDINSKIEVEVTEDDVVVDISGATTKELTVKRPDNTTFTRQALFSDTGVNGLIHFLTIAGDLNLEGTYYIQAYIVLPSWNGHSTIGEFTVEENLV